MKKNNSTTINFSNKMNSIIKVYQKITQFVDIFEFSKREIDDPNIKRILGGDISTKQYYYVALYFLCKLCNDVTSSKYKKETLKYLTLDLRFSKNKLRTIFAIANFYSFVGDNIDAVRYFQAGVKAKDKRFMNSLGDHYMRLGMYSEATTTYLTAINTDSRLNHLGYCYDRLGQLDKAMKFFKQAVRHGDIFAFDNIGFIYQHVLQNKVTALKFYKKAIELGNLFAIQHYLTINNNIADIIKLIQKGISKGVFYSFVIPNDYIRPERNDSYLYDNQVLLYYIRKYINDDTKFAYKPMLIDDKATKEVLKFRKQIMSMKYSKCKNCLDLTMCISDCNNNKYCPHCHIQFLYS